MKIKDLIFKIENLNFNEALEYLDKKAQKKGKKTFVVTINPEIVMLAREDKEYEKVIKSADLALPDGIGVIWAGKMFGREFSGRVHGSDLVEALCRKVSKQPITVGFLGGYENVAQTTAERLSKKYPGLKVAFAVEEWEGAEVAHETFLGLASLLRRPTKNFASSPRQIINHKSSIINHQTFADILFVAFGSPKQEIWIYDNLPKLPVRVVIGVGGAFDFISGRVARAPAWVRNIGFEWLFRLLIQPWRWKRQTALLKFVFLVLKEKLS